MKAGMLLNTFRDYYITVKVYALFCVLLVRYSADQLKKTEVGRTCGACRGEECYIQGFVGETLREGYHLKDPGVNLRIILK
jgi:hypothetical protein